MGKRSKKENKTVYQDIREKLGLTREKASEKTGLEPFKIERIENEKIEADPWDVIAMAEGYKEPKLCNYYCANECPIGRKYVPEIKTKDLAQVVLEMLASLNSMRKKQERLIEITADGNVSNEELSDFIFIQQELEKISIAVEALQLWTEQMIANGKIDPKEYEKLKEEGN